jgi:FtsH-binding integral membrane protein
VIELLFLFAPLVIVPLGLELGRIIASAGSDGLQNVARILQPFAAALAVVSFWFPPGWVAGALAVPWLAVCALVALAGLLSLARSTHSLPAMAVNLGRMDLAVAGGWLLVSRLGMRPMDFQEPILLLTAVHFHYTAFATALLAAAALTFARQHGRHSRTLSLVTALVIALPFALAAGFVLSPTLKVAAALGLSASVLGLAVAQLWLSKGLHSATARGFLRISALSVIAGMILAGIYALGEFLARDWLLIPRMASTHGLLNGLGFVLLGLLAWLVECHSAQPLAPKPTRVRSQHEQTASVWFSPP